MKKISLIFATLFFISCNIHEAPDIPTETKLTINLDFDTDIPIHKEITHTRTNSINNADNYDVRHIISVHRLYSDENYNREADTLIAFTCNDITNLNCSGEIKLPEGNYNLFVWTDYVNKGCCDDKFYTTSDFKEIILQDQEKHIGACEYSEAFRGTQKATVTVKKSEMMEVKNEVTITMNRPMARFKFVSTDYDLFVEKMLKREARKAALKEGNTKNENESRSINPENYYVIFHYSGFMPCSYNMFTDKPADARTGVSFESSLKPITNEEVELGFDNVFVNGSESGVSIMLEVYHKDGELIASSPAIDVPLKRSKLTIVKGKFLTSVAKGGVDINPDFSGEWNIEIK